MSACNWMEQQGECVALVEHANAAQALCYEAMDTIRALETLKSAQGDQLDLFAQAVSQAEIDFWWTIHKATGDEYRRRAKKWMLSCRHGKVSDSALKEHECAAYEDARA